FINDIIIISNTVKDYLYYFETIFVLFIEKNILISLKKSFIGFPSVELFGFYINVFGLTSIEERIEAIYNLIFPN
ncbi:hypothetical protein GE21DRAFT_1213077, partial [Neurospora crassa]